MTRSGLLALISWFAGVSLLAAASRWHAGQGDPGRCSLDGAAIEPVRRIDLLVAGSGRARFCSLPCALAWPELPAGATWQVRDETSGRPIDATLACFVEGRLAAGRGGSRIRAFERAEDATNYCSKLGGSPIASPFATATPEHVVPITPTTPLDR